MLVIYAKSVAANYDYPFTSQPAITCSNLTVETLEECAKSVQS